MPNSPHLQAAKSKAQFLIEIAENDDMRSPNEKNVLKETFGKAHLRAEIEVYAGAAHGWLPSRFAGLQRATGREGMEPFACAVRQSPGLNIERDRGLQLGRQQSYVLLNALRPFVTVKLPSDLADTLIQ